MQISQLYVAKLVNYPQKTKKIRGKNAQFYRKRLRLDG